MLASDYTCTLSHVSNDHLSSNVLTIASVHSHLSFTQRLQNTTYKILFLHFTFEVLKNLARSENNFVELSKLCRTLKHNEQRFKKFCHFSN